MRWSLRIFDIDRARRKETLSWTTSELFTREEWENNKSWIRGQTCIVDVSIREMSTRSFSPSKLSSSFRPPSRRTLPPPSWSKAWLGVGRKLASSVSGKQEEEVGRFWEGNRGKLIRAIRIKIEGKGWHN